MDAAVVIVVVVVIVLGVVMGTSYGDVVDGEGG